MENSRITTRVDSFGVKKNQHEFAQATVEAWEREEGGSALTKQRERVEIVGKKGEKEANRNSQ